MKIKRIYQALSILLMLTITLSILTTSSFAEVSYNNDEVILLEQFNINYYHTKNGEVIIRDDVNSSSRIFLDYCEHELIISVKRVKVGVVQFSLINKIIRSSNPDECKHGLEYSVRGTIYHSNGSTYNSVNKSGTVLVGPAGTVEDVAGLTGQYLNYKVYMIATFQEALVKEGTINFN